MKAFCTGLCGSTLDRFSSCLGSSISFEMELTATSRSRLGLASDWRMQVGDQNRVRNERSQWPTPAAKASSTRSMTRMAMKPSIGNSVSAPSGHIDVEAHGNGSTVPSGQK